MEWCSISWGTGRACYQFRMSAVVESRWAQQHERSGLFVTCLEKGKTCTSLRSTEALLLHRMVVYDRGHGLEVAELHKHAGPRLASPFPRCHLRRCIEDGAPRSPCTLVLPRAHDGRHRSSACSHFPSSCSLSPSPTLPYPYLRRRCG